MTNISTIPSIDEYLRERLMPVEGAIPHIPGIEMFGNSIPAGTVGGDLFEYVNFRSAMPSTHAFNRLSVYQRSFANYCLRERLSAIQLTITCNG
jgi:hypothetical protein